MSGIMQLLLSGRPQVASDPNFEYTTLLLPGNGTNGAQNNTFLDSSTNNFTITRNGNTTQGTFSPFSQTGWSNYFDGNADYLTVASNAAFGYGTGDFTIEMWIYPTVIQGASTPNLFDQRTANPQVVPTIYLNNGQLIYYVNGLNRITGATLTANQWYHIAVCRASGSTRMFLNGTQTGSTYTDANNYITSPITIFTQGPAAAIYQEGYCSNLRVVKGTALYTAAFTPPTTPLTAISGTSLLTCQSNRFIDNSTNNFAITRNGDVSVQAFSPFNPTAAWSAATNGGSGYFDGSGDYLTAPSNAAFAPGTGNFTVEAWVYPTAFSNYRAIFDTRGTITNTGMDLGLAASSAGVWGLYKGSAVTVVQSNTNLTLNTWQHVAAVRSGSTVTLYLNGVNVGSNTDAQDFSQQSCFVGTTSDNYAWQGYIASLRFVKGTAVYTSAFTPPTSPVTAITNTSLLLNFTNAGIFDATSKNDLETVGNAQISTTQSKFGGSSISFDGSGDVLVAPNSRFYDFSSGDFTVEFWFRTNTLTPSSPSGGSPGYACIVAQQNWNGLSGNGWGIWQFNQTIIFITPGGTLAQFATGNIITSTSTWYHIAVVRSGTGANNTKIYIDGVQQGQGTPTITFSTRQLTVGGTNSAYGWDQEYTTNGFINDVRITRYARYTTNFTPPTAAFPLL